MTEIPSISRDDKAFALYVHWPFCQSKCPYCDFNSHVAHGAVDVEAFARAYIREIAYFAARTGPRSLASIFFGGGTPSLMPGDLVAQIIEAACRYWSPVARMEVTLEANPSSVEADRFAAYRAGGVNRLSLGVQALNDPDLKALGRLHSADQARRALEVAQKTFARVSIDLIYARPHQRLEDWDRELNTALALGVTHLSAYQLTLESGTPFAALHAAGKLTIPGEAAAADFYQLTQKICNAKGLPAYEISNHAAPEMECRHNLVYWRYGDYVGVGPGAHGRLTGRRPGRRYACATEPNPQKWLERVQEQGHGHGLIVNDLLSAEEQGDEYLLMGLRLAEGIDLGRYERISGRSLDPRQCRMLEEHALIHRLGKNRVAVTPAGFLLLDAVVADLAA